MASLYSRESRFLINFGCLFRRDDFWVTAWRMRAPHFRNHGHTATSEELKMIPQTSALPVLAARRVRKTMWSRLRTVFFDSYRPELHYMRGPGPKWREKRDPLHLAGIQVTPIPRCRAAQGKLARKFLLEWLPSGLATFTIGAVLQHLLSPYIL